MKKIIVCIISAALLCCVLSACGSTGADMNPSASASPDVMPSISPEINDGLVGDRDGILDDDNGLGMNDGVMDGNTAPNGNGITGDNNGNGTTGGVVDDNSGTGAVVSPMPSQPVNR